MTNSLSTPKATVLQNVRKDRCCSRDRAELYFKVKVADTEVAMNIRKLSLQKHQNLMIYHVDSEFERQSYEWSSEIQTIQYSPIGEWMIMRPFACSLEHHLLVLRQFYLRHFSNHTALKLLYYSPWLGYNLLGVLKAKAYGSHLCYSIRYNKLNEILCEG